MGKFSRECDEGREHRLGTRIRQYRWRQGVPRTTLAETTGLDLGRLISVESGDTLITERELDAIARALTVSVDALEAPVEMEPGDALPPPTIRVAMESVLSRYMARLEKLEPKRAV